MPKVSPKYHEQRRAEVMAAARRTFLRNGFHATSMQDLLDEADASSGSVYRYFTGKDDLIFAIAEENLEAIVAITDAAAVHASDISVGEVFADAFERALQRHAIDGVAGIALLVWAEALRNSALAAKLAGLQVRLKNDIIEVVRVHQSLGTLPSSVGPEALATVLMSIVPGLLIQLAVLGPDSMAGSSDAIRALWPPVGTASSRG